MVAGKAAGGPVRPAGRGNSGCPSHKHIGGSGSLSTATPRSVGGSSPGAGPADRPHGGGGSGWSSRSAVGTGPLRRSPAVHAPPIDLVVFQEPSTLLRPEASSRRGLRA